MSTIGALREKALGKAKTLPKANLPKPKIEKRKTPHIWSAAKYKKGQEQK